MELIHPEWQTQEFRGHFWYIGCVYAPWHSVISHLFLNSRQEAEQSGSRHASLGKSVSYFYFWHERQPARRKERMLKTWVGLRNSLSLWHARGLCTIKAHNSSSGHGWHVFAFLPQQNSAQRVGRFSPRKKIHMTCKTNIMDCGALWNAYML